MTAPSYSSWFSDLTRTPAPHRWQQQLGEAPDCRDRLIRIPTGFGKTAGAVLPWLYHRVVRANPAWPTRLVFCLPMRVLVEQTHRAIKRWLEQEKLEDKVGLHLLLGGVDPAPWPWALHPERPAILVGTQDMLLSRALNRGFASYRARWPIEFGLLNTDTLWVVDEVQLMDVGLATTAQLAALRRNLSPQPLRPSRTWWMSATLQPSWLATIDLRNDLPALQAEAIRIAAKERKGGLWGTAKELLLERSVGSPEGVAGLVADRHAPGTLTLVIANRVDRAREIHSAIRATFDTGQKGKERSEPIKPMPDLRLIHSQFRGHERAQWADTFLARAAELPPAGRIIVSTQVVEAGVDISARLLVTDVAPWPSLVQRFGRVARYIDPEGKPEKGTAVVAGKPPSSQKEAAPYDMEGCAAAVDALSRLKRSEGDVAPRWLEQFEETLEKDDDPLLERLYHYEPAQVLRDRDVLELFDTTADLSGADIDVSPFIREGDERDAQVFWRNVDPRSRTIGRATIGSVHRAELCPVKLDEVRDWLKGRIAYRLDYVAGEWSRVDPRQLTPGTVLLIPSSFGGYHLELGWSPKAGAPVDPVPSSAEVPPGEEKLDEASSSQDDDALSRAAWKSIAFHGREAGQIAAEIARTLQLSGQAGPLLELTGRWHDTGKAHTAFQERIKKEARESAGARGLRQDLAKAPDDAWSPPPYRNRPGFRHEMASTLAMFELLRRLKPDHQSLAGGAREILDAIGTSLTPPSAEETLTPSHALANELSQLSSEAFDLVAWLVCTHHGKVRCNWTSTPRDQAGGTGTIFGVVPGESLPGVSLYTMKGERELLPPLSLFLDCAGIGVNPRYGLSWRERVARLLRRQGPFTLAYFEALFRAADGRASGLETEEPE